MADGEGPWKRDPEPQGSGFRMVLWFAVLVAIGVAVWKLAELFPGQMSSDMDRVSLIWWLTILTVVSASVIFSRRYKWRDVVRNIAIWLGVVAVLVLGFTFQNDLRDIALRIRSQLIPGYAVATGQDVMAISENADGHFYVIGEVRGSPIRFLIDTGASDIVLSPADAARIGIDPARLDFTRQYETANGVGRGAPYTLARLSIGPIALDDVAISINQAEMDSSLLGMAFLKRMSSYEFRDRQLFLRWR